MDGGDLLPETYGVPSGVLGQKPPVVWKMFGTIKVQDLAGFAFMMVCAYLFAAIPGVVADVYSRVEDTSVLPDVLFDALPHVETYEFFNDKAEMIFIALSAPCLLLQGKLQLAARQIYAIQGVLWILRAPAFLVTQMPNPYKRCQVDESITLQYSEYAQLFQSALKVLQGKTHTCSDVMFSGHTAGVTMLLCVTLRHLPSSSTLLKMLFILQYSATVLLMIMSHFHYTVDVYVGALVSAMVCHIYFTSSSSGQAKRIDTRPSSSSSSASRGNSNRLEALLAWYEQDL